MSGDGSSLNDAGLKVVITLTILFVIISFSMLMAKLCHCCRKDRAIADDKSDISAQTRDLIRARLALIQFRKHELSKARRSQAVAGVIRKWLTVIRDRKKDDARSKDGEKGEGAKTVVNLKDKVTSLVSNGHVGVFTCKESKDNNGDALERDDVREDVGNVQRPGQENGRQGMSRSSAFSKPQTAGGASKQTEMILKLQQTIVNEIESPVPRGRPVSSRSRGSSNVTLTDVEMNGVGVTKHTLKSVSDGQLKRQHSVDESTGNHANSTVKVKQAIVHIRPKTTGAIKSKVTKQKQASVRSSSRTTIKNGFKRKT